jgi:hypothetical protein
MAMFIPLNVLVPIAVVVLIFIFILWFLYTKNKNLAKSLMEKTTRFSGYEKAVESLKNSPQNPKKDFETLNTNVRGFFKEYYNLDYSLTYLELEEEFKKQNKPEYVKFFRMMSDTNYKEKNKSSEEVKRLIEMFSKLIYEKR